MSRQKRSTNTGFKGVSLRSNGRYEASVNIQGKRVFFKSTSTLQNAVEARNNYIFSLI